MRSNGLWHSEMMVLCILVSKEKNSAIKERQCMIMFITLKRIGGNLPQMLEASFAHNTQ